MTPSEAVILDWLLERGYTREQAARALVALSLPEPSDLQLTATRKDTPSGRVYSWDAALMQAQAERRGYLPKPG